MTVFGRGFDSRRLHHKSPPMGVTVYVLEGLRTGKRYVGIAGDLQSRLRDHRSRRTKGAQLLGDFQLIYSEVLETYAEARVREKFLKSGQGRAWLLKVQPRTRPA